MQTFLPYAEFDTSAEVLDRARLGKQRIECLQLLRALKGETKGWRNHPAARMWAGHEYWLARYGDVVCTEWIKRGYKDTTREKIRALADQFSDVVSLPQWLGDKDFHLSHQSNLLRKDPAHYGKFFPGVSPDLPYVWPA